MWTFLHIIFNVCIVAQSRPTLCDHLDCSLPGSLSTGILQARILEWVAMPSFKGSCQHRDQTQVSHIIGGFFTVWATGEAQLFFVFCFLCIYNIKLYSCILHAIQGKKYLSDIWNSLSCSIYWFLRLSCINSSYIHKNYGCWHMSIPYTATIIIAVPTGI